MHGIAPFLVYYCDTLAVQPLLERLAPATQQCGQPLIELWMMYRSGWGTKPGQEVTLAVRIKRQGFDSILMQAVHSTYQPEVYSTSEQWKQQLTVSPIRLQWDPDHDPQGAKQERRAIQLGLSGEVLKKYAREWIVEIQDISEFVASQRQHALARDRELVTPREEIYPVTDEAVFRRLQLSTRISVSAADHDEQTEA